MTVEQGLSITILIVLLIIGWYRVYAKSRRKQIESIMEATWARAVSEGVDLENEVFWMLIPSARVIMAIKTVEDRDAVIKHEKGILICVSFRSEIQTWYI